jgi:hypothetical protein
MLESYPLTSELHDYRRRKISSRFPFLSASGHGYYLSLWKFLEQIPERFFSSKACDDIHEFLYNLKTTEAETLSKILMEYETLLIFAFQCLSEINSLGFHDTEIPSDDIHLMRLCDNHIHPNYLKLTEAAYANLSLPMSVYQRIRRKASLEGFDVFNRVEELSKSQYSYLAKPYNNVVRNAIAHGKVTYKPTEIVYEDKKGHSVTLSSKDVIRLFDEMLDICNGLSLGLRLFYFTNSEFLQRYGIAVPRPIMIEELRAETEAPGWEIRGCLESETLYGAKQLNIFTRNRFLDPLKAQYHVIRSAVLAERFAPGYGRYFVLLDSKYSLSGWAAFDGPKLNSARQEDRSTLKDSFEALEEGLIFFVPKVKLPRFFFRLSSLVSALKVLAPLKRREYQEKHLPLLVDARDIKMHRNGFYCVIRGSVVVKSNTIFPMDQLIRNNCRWIVRKVVKAARKRAKTHNLSRYLRVGYLMVGVFSEDFRIRKLQSSGLIPELLCTIEFKRLKRVRTLDILGGKPEKIGKFRVVWNVSPMSPSPVP